ncbi:RING finger protein 17 [Patella vulgata]|uniref:RING finger protein 17 n=1 Tax=Patella vulgata TaxID=6465 RepID=UPI0024A849E8|nr:RING finger protein 17 [Patella vulgata]
MIGMLLCNQRNLVDQELSRLIPAGASTTLRRSVDRKYSDKLFCQECNMNKATCRCVKCDCFMCGLCFTKVHSKYNALRQHQALELGDGGDSVIIKEETANVCKEHDSRPIEYFCEDDLTPICSRCVIIGEHKGHSITSMEDKNKLVLADMEPALQIANHVIKKLRTTEQSFNDLLPNAKTETCTVIDDIRSHFQSLHGILQSREQSLIKQVHDKFNNCLLPLLYKKADLIEEKRRLESAVKAAQRILNNNNENVLNAQEILDHLTKAKDIPCIAVKQTPESTDSIRWSCGESVDDIIKNHGTVEGSIPNRFTIQTASEVGDVDDTDTLSTVSHSSHTSHTSHTDTINSGEDVIIEDDTCKEVLLEEYDKNVKRNFVLDKQTYRAKYPGHCEQVYITHIKNPTQFYCQKKNDKSKLYNMSKNMNIWCQSLSRECDIPTHVEEGDLVIGMYSDDKKWYRARVKRVIPPISPGDASKTTDTCAASSDTCASTQDSEASQTDDNIIKTKIKKKRKNRSQNNEEKAEVLFFDYGNTEVLPLSKMRNMQQRFLKLPSFMLECALHDIEPNNDEAVWPKEAAQTVKKMTDGKVMFMNVIREINGVLQVDLHKPPDNDIMDDRPVSLRESLIFLELARFASSSDPENIKPVLPVVYTARSYTTTEPRMEAEIFDVVVTSPDTPYHFFVQPLGDEAQYLTTMMTKMQQTYSVDSGDLYTVYCPQKDMICVAQYTSDGLWYRARVVNIPGRKLVDVQYVDYGYVDRIPYWNIRKILDSFLVLPPQAVYCKLCDIAPVNEKIGWTNEALQWWHETVAFKQFQLKIQGIEDNQFSVVLNHIDEDNPSITVLNMNSEIVTRGYAKSTGIWSSGKITADAETRGSEEKLETFVTLHQSSSSSSSALDTPKYRSPEITPVNSPISTPTKPVHKVTSTSQTQASDISETSTSPIPATINSSPVTPTRFKQNVAEKLSVNVQKAAEKTPTETHKEADSGPSSVQIEVFLSSYVSPSEFHVQLAKSQDNHLKFLMEELQKDCEGSEPSLRSWKQKDFCAARYSKDELWYRANIVEVISKNMYRVYLVDYGHKDTVSGNNIRTLKNELRKMSCAAVRCHLANIYPAGTTDRTKWSQTAREYMEQEVKNKTCYIKKEGDLDNDSLGLPIDLLLEEDVPETALEPARKIVFSLKNRFIESGLCIPSRRSSPEKMYDSVKRVNNPYYEYKKHPVPESKILNVTPCYVDYEGVIYAQIVDEESDLTSLNEKLQSTYTLSEPIVCDWKEGQACIALFEGDGLWYRGKVITMEEDRLMVLFLDYGNVTWQSYTSIRPPTPEILEIPQLSLECMLHNILPISDNGKWPIVVLEHMHHSIVSHIITIVVKDVSVDNLLMITARLPDGNDLAGKLISMEAVYSTDDLSIECNFSAKITNILKDSTLPLKPVQPFPCGMKFPVLVTHIELPNLVYCQHVALDATIGSEDYRVEAQRVNSNLIELQDLSIDLNNSAPQSHRWTFLPKPGNVCSAQYSVDDCWYRGIVIEVVEESSLVYVLFVDYGNAEFVHLDRLRVLPKKLQKLPMQAMRCHIANLMPAEGQTTFTKDILKIMPEILGQSELLAQVKATSPLTVELYLLKMEEKGLQLAYQRIIDEGLAQLAEVSKLCDITGCRGEDNPDVICEEIEEHRRSPF